jgi:glutamate-ammonia-ligase adenylyltransferase
MNTLLVSEYSRYARDLLSARPELTQELEAAAEARWTRAAMRQFLGIGGVETPSSAEMTRRLRELRARVMLRTMQRDLAGVADLAEVCGAMTTLAEMAVETGLAALETDLQGDARTAPRLIVVAMGKLGGGELNVSSDIDLVFVHAGSDEDEITANGRKRSYAEHFGALGRRLVAWLSEATADGALFRVDMRLRPWGDAGPLAISIDALEEYFLVHGREWERYAWIKSRPLSGSEEDLRQLAQVVRPFVYRKYLDYGAIAAMRDLHVQIRAEVERREYAEHVKLGPGGIREIEFIAQAQQLIRGGRMPELQARPTLQVLQLLDARGLMEPGDSARLCEAYDFLRRTEHRIQYLDDAQTHELPHVPDDRARLARAMGARDWTGFMGELNRHRQVVSERFERMFSDKLSGQGAARTGVREATAAALWPAQALPDVDPAAAEEAALRALGESGFGDAAGLYARLLAVRKGARYQALPESSRSRFDALVPLFIEAAASGADRGTRDDALTRLLNLLEAISRRAAYLALLHEHPAAVERLAKLFGASSWAAEYLTLHPILLDELLHARLLLAEPDWTAAGRQLRQALATAEGDAERQMDILREVQHAHLFRLLAQDLEGALSVERLADHLSALADLMLAVTLELCWAQLPRRQGMGSDAPRFAIIGYGKLGGKELGYASDLDVIFLYDGDSADEDQAAEVYARLAQRINVWLASRTAAGVLYETDLRLRPNGAGGLLVSSMDAFRRYQRESAWVWEHQALTRARFCAGDAAVGAAFEEERRVILRAERDPAGLAAEVRTMRQTMREGHPNRSALFDLKHDPGGMVDIEFIVQYLVLAHARQHQELTLNHGNIALLGYCARLGLIDAKQAAAVRDAYRVLRRLQHALRLKGERYARVPADEVAAHAEATLALWRAVLEAPFEAGGKPGAA